MQTGSPRALFIAPRIPGNGLGLRISLTWVPVQCSLNNSSHVIDIPLGFSRHSSIFSWGIA